MQRRVGIVRWVERLQQARAELDTLLARIEHHYPRQHPSVIACETRNIAVCAWLITECALQRHESRGLHYVVDYPEPRAEFVRPTLLVRHEKS
jgi:L-aspartate oxidase